LLFKKKQVAFQIGLGCGLPETFSKKEAITVTEVGAFHNKVEREIEGLLFIFIVRELLGLLLRIKLLVG
jgi:hypothetical protein